MLVKNIVLNIQYTATCIENKNYNNFCLISFAFFKRLLNQQFLMTLHENKGTGC